MLWLLLVASLSKKPPDHATFSAGLTLAQAVAKSTLVDDNQGHVRMRGGKSQYEFGNLVCNRGTWAGCCCGHPCVATKCASKHLQPTIGCHFLNASLAIADLPVLTSTINEYAVNHGLPSDSLPPSTLVVHLRLGDGSSAGYIPQSFESEHTLATDLPRLPRGVTHVVLVGSLNSGNHGDHPKYLNASIGHVTRVTNLFEANGYHVQQRLNGVSSSEVDADIVYMTRAVHFLCTKGTFSILIARMVDYRGGASSQLI